MLTQTDNPYIRVSFAKLHVDTETAEVARVVNELSYICERCGRGVTAQVTHVGGAAPHIRVRRRLCQCELVQAEIEAEQKRQQKRDEERPNRFFTVPGGTMNYERLDKMRFATWDRARARAQYETMLAWAQKAAELWSVVDAMERDETISTAAKVQARARALSRLYNVAVLGKYGLGKTHLLAAIAHHLVDHDVPVLFVSAVDFLDALRNTMHDGYKGPSYERLCDRLMKVAVLIIDDVGYENAKNLVRVGNADMPIESFSQKVFHRILNARYNAEKPTLISTLSEDALREGIGEAAMQRVFHGGGLLKMPASLPSYRKQFVQTLSPESIAAIRPPSRDDVRTNAQGGAPVLRLLPRE